MNKKTKVQYLQMIQTIKPKGKLEKPINLTCMFLNIGANQSTQIKLLHAMRRAFKYLQAPNGNQTQVFLAHFKISMDVAIPLSKGKGTTAHLLCKMTMNNKRLTMWSTGKSWFGLTFSNWLQPHIYGCTVNNGIGIGGHGNDKNHSCRFKGTFTNNCSSKKNLNVFFIVITLAVHVDVCACMSALHKVTF